MSESNPDQHGAAPAQPDSSRSAVEGLGQTTWSEAEGVSYEVAIESINSVIGAYSGLIGDEELAETSDADKIAGWRQAKLEWADRRRALSPNDTDAVQAVRQETAALLADLTGRR